MIAPGDQRSWGRRAVVLGAGAALVFCAALLALSDVSGGGAEGSRVELQAAPGRVEAMKEELAEESSRLEKVKGEFSKIHKQQSSLKQQEDHLQSKERSIRAQVHQARNSVVSLKYKIHNLEAVRFSNALFSSKPEAAKARKDQAHQNLLKKAQAAAVTGKQQPKLSVAKPEGQVQGAEGLATAAVPTIQQTAETISRLAEYASSQHPERARLADERAHPEVHGIRGSQPLPRQQAQGVQKMAVISPKYVVSTTAPRPNYQVALNMAAAARAQAYERSAAFKEQERRAALERQEMGFLRMPALPILKPLGPEAAGP